ncbi:MAG: RluA family pseudouridine synthase [Clostridia bacterium]|nr:RluA family pseudouridine synthase [Clostridia bacterium]
MENNIITVETGGDRADKFISENVDNVSRSYAAKLLEDGNITLEGKIIKPSQKLKAGDRLYIDMPEPKDLEVVAEDIPIDVVYEDDSVIVINKPADMVVHPADGNFTGTLVNALLFRYKDSLSTINGVHRPGIVHRLDKDTTGLIMVARGDKAHSHLSDQLKTRTLKRTYMALVHGNIREDDGVIHTKIARSVRDRKKMSVTEGEGREAITRFEVIERFGIYTLVYCHLDTGRTHQIRVHMRHIGHPVVGDKTYGIKKEEFALEGQLLHAGKIGFIHPETEEYKEFTAPVPEAFERVLTILRKR